MSLRLLAVSGSLRSRSVNQDILQYLHSVSADRVSWDFYDELDQLPAFNPDVTEDPEAVARWKDRLAKADGVVICSPEYVFAMPGALKNALDWTVSGMVWEGKPTFPVTASLSGEKAHESLLLVLRTLGASITEDRLIPNARTTWAGQQEELKEMMERFLSTLNQS
jgi:chromate reductase